MVVRIVKRDLDDEGDMGDGASHPHPNPVAAGIAAAAEALGCCPGARSRARKHGFRPKARRHVERYLLVKVAGVRVADLARAEGYSRSNLYRSVQVGGELARRNALALGLTPADLLGLGPAA